MLAPGTPQSAAAISVRYTEGLVHGFLVLRTLQGEALAHGDLTQIADGNVVRSRIVFRFRNGSLYDETTVYSERRRFRLVSDHVMQSGPSFPHPEDISIDARSGHVKVVHYTEDNSKPEVESERMRLPVDLANGLIFTLVKNIPRNSSETKVSMIVTTPKPRLAKLVFSDQGEDRIVIGGERREVMHYMIRIEIGGVTGVVAPLVGKEPPPINVWVLGGEAPAVIKSEGPLYTGGPVWQIELESP